MRGPTCEDVIRVALDRFEVSRPELLTKTRRQPFVTYRMIAMAVCREAFSWPLSHVATRFGGYDHTTVLNASRTVARQIEHGRADIAEAYQWIRERAVERFVSRAFSAFKESA